MKMGEEVWSTPGTGHSTAHTWNETRNKQDKLAWLKIIWFPLHIPKHQNHLFFSCVFAKQIWKQVLQACGIQRQVDDCKDEFNWAIQRLKGGLLSQLFCTQPGVPLYITCGKSEI